MRWLSQACVANKNETWLFSMKHKSDLVDGFDKDHCFLSGCVTDVFPKLSELNVQLSGFENFFSAHMHFTICHKVQL